MNEAVRSNLSEKKKIKDLFLVVIRSIDIKKNKVVVSSLIQFISNLCYGTGRLRTMLAKEDTGEFMATLKQILVQVKEKDEPAEDEDKDEDEEEHEEDEEEDAEEEDEDEEEKVGELGVAKAVAVAAMKGGPALEGRRVR
jgi:Sec-independent protein translocase protein TatA